MTRNHRTPGVSAGNSGERQGGHRRAQSPRVAEEVRKVALHLEKNQTQIGFLGAVPREIGRLGVFGGSFHRLVRLVASRLPPRRTTPDSLRVVPRVQPRGVSA